jgi:hypothetical protein
MKAYIDSIPVQFPNETIKDPTFTLRKKDEGGGFAFTFTGDLTFIKDDYDYIYQKLKTDPNAKTNKIELKFVDDCCASEKEYLFEISHESLLWCEGKCEITAAAIEKDSTNDIITCLNNTLIYDNWNGFQNKQHPRMVYCNETRPNWTQHFYIIIGVLFGQLILCLTPVWVVIALLVTIVNAIINAINFLLPDDKDLNTIDFDNDPSTNIFEEMKNLFNTLISFIVGCGRKHPSPLVRDYAQNVCQKCGVNFVSSIFSPGSSYYNTVWVQAAAHKGTTVSNTSTYWIDENKPIESGIMFFDKLKKVYNADYTIVNGNFLFERKDLLYPNAAPFLDLTTYPKDKIIDICWSYEQKDLPSYASFRYQKDVVNWLGHETDPRWRGIINWNTPYSSLQSGAYEPIFEFTGCRFRDDGIDEDILTKYENFPYVGPIIKSANRAMLINSHNTVLPMLIIWDQDSGKANATAKGSDTYFPGIPNGGEKQTFVGLNEFYNYPYWFKEGYNNNLYTNFHYIDNPKLSTYKGLEFKATLFFDCALKDALDVYGKVLTSEGLSTKIKEININHKTGILTITGLV